MFRQMVLWKLHDQAEAAYKPTHLQNAKELLLDDAQVLAAYPNHPHHLVIQPFINAVVQERRCMDFNVE
jgi:hypothetical protein